MENKQSVGDRRIDARFRQFAWYGELYTSVLQCVAMSCRVLQGVTVCYKCHRVLFVQTRACL